MLSSKLFTLVVVASIYFVSSNSVAGQDVAELAMRARTNLYDKWNFDSVAYYLDRVIGKKYTPAFAYSDYGWYLMLVDKYEEGLTYIQRAAEMDPADKQLVAWNSWALVWSGDLPKAKRWIQKALAIDPNYGEALYINSLIASEMGNHEEAISLAKKAAFKDLNWRAGVPLALVKASKREEAIVWAQKIAKDENVFDAMILMEVFGNLRNDDKALHYLQKSYELRHPFMPWLNFVPSTKYLHADSRFKAIVQKMNLPR
jgi:tetratricopeptide (TPR) repeat protein